MRLSQVLRLLLAAAVIVLAVAGLAGCTSGGPVAKGQGTASRVGDKAPDFQFSDAAGNTVSLNSLRGKTVVLNFWASWCGPCRQEMPYIQALAADNYRASHGLVLLTVNDGEAQEAITAFMNTYGYSFTVIRDADGTLGQQYNLRYLPTTFFIGPDGIIRYIQTGPFQSRDHLVQILDSVMQ